jgi:hypothetical protein
MHDLGYATAAMREQHQQQMAWLMSFKEQPIVYRARRAMPTLQQLREENHMVLPDQVGRACWAGLPALTVLSCTCCACS